MLIDIETLKNLIINTDFGKWLFMVSIFFGIVQITYILMKRRV